MQIDVEIIQTQFEVSQAQSERNQRASYRYVNQDCEILIGHDSGFDHIAFQVTTGQTDWVSRTSSLDVRGHSISGFNEIWESGAYIIRYPFVNRSEMQQFVVEVIEGIDYSDPIQSSEIIIERWIQIWRNQEPLGREQQMGLFGELSVLEKLISAKNADVVENWTGPEGATHDFEFAPRHIEVKTTGFSEPVLKISSFNQLRPCNPPLFLVMVQLEIGSGRTLPSLVAQIRRTTSSNTTAERLFEMRLERARYNDDHAIRYLTEYGEPRFRFIQIDESVDVLHEDRLDNPVRGLVDLKWSLDSSTLSFEEIEENFWSV